MSTDQQEDDRENLSGLEYTSYMSWVAIQQMKAETLCNLDTDNHYEVQNDN